MAAKHTSDAELLTGPPGHPVVFLLDAASEYEARLLRRWLGKHAPGSIETVRINSSRRRRSWAEHQLDHLLDDETTYLIPTRVVWMAPEKDGRRSVNWTDIFKPGDPRDPYPIRARLIRTFKPGRVKLIAATGATVGALKADYAMSGEIDGETAFITRRAWRTLDKPERRLRGNRYKVPRFVPEAILSRGELARALEAHAGESGRPIEEVRSKAERYLKEIAATHSPYVIDIIANGIHALYRQGYGRIRYSAADVARVAALSADHPVVFLPSHRSNLDRLSLQFMLWENDLPPNHTAGGINLNFFPIGPLLRRTGVFFIRRSFKGNELYKIVLRAYIDYLIEKRFPLEWYLEGGRSRSGKLNAPRLGLLNYVVDAQRRGKSDDIQLVPVSIAYDQIQDVPDYAREAQGKTKEKESIGWLIKAVRSLRQRYGDIHIRFGDPVSVADMIDEIGDEETSIGLQKLVFEVMYRIAFSTPVTPIALVSVALLASRGEASTPQRLADECGRLVDFIEARGLPTTENLDMSNPGNVSPIADWLAEHGNVSSHEAIDRRVFWLDDDQMIRISYYRNIIVHYFVNRSIAEIALASTVDVSDRDAATVRSKMMELRDLLKFEFFFPEKDVFLANVETDIAIDVPDWESVLTTSGPLGVLAKMGEPVAFWAVLPFLDAYQVVGDELESLTREFDERAFLQRCLDRARMYRIERRLFSGESASQVLFKSALALAENRGLLDDSEGVVERRRSFASEVREARDLAAEGL